MQRLFCFAVFLAVLLVVCCRAPLPLSEHIEELRSQGIRIPDDVLLMLERNAAPQQAAFARDSRGNGKPTFIRFGKRAKPTFIRFGKRSF